MNTFENLSVFLFSAFVLSASIIILYNRIPASWLKINDETPRKKYIGFYKPMLILFLYFSVINIMLNIQFGDDKLLFTLLLIFLALFALASLLSAVYSKIPTVLILLLAIISAVFLYFDIIRLKGYFYSLYYSPFLGCVLLGVFAFVFYFIQSRFLKRDIIKISVTDLALSVITGLAFGFNVTVAVLVLSLMILFIFIALSKITGKKACYAYALFSAISICLIFYRQINCLL